MFAPKEMQALKRWVNANEDSKIPMYQGTFAPVSEPTLWTDFDTAVKNVDDGFNDYVGFVFHDDGIVGIDIDKGFDDDGLLSDISLDIISHCKSTTEVSKSGRGFHIYIKGKLPFKGANNQKGVEIYRDARFFVYTGNTFLYENLVEDQQAIDYIVGKYFFDIAKPKTSHRVLYAPKHQFVDGKLKTIYPPVMEGSRNASMASYAGICHKRGMSYEAILKALEIANKESCQPPLTIYELRTIVNSITRYEREAENEEKQ